MGLAVLPSRLKQELSDLERVILDGEPLTEDLQKHAQWLEELKSRCSFTRENTEMILKMEVGKVFAKVLTHAGVYKRDPEGIAAFERFVRYVNREVLETMNFLVTGGAGYIGSHTAVELMNAGHHPIIVDDLSNARWHGRNRIGEITGRVPAFYQIDCADKKEQRQVFKDYEIDAVIHFAGFKAVGESVREPLKYYRNNIDSTLTLLEVMEEAGCKKLVFSSSATVYGPNNPHPYKEEMPAIQSSSPYGWTKVMIERILTDYCTAHPDFCAILLRYFNPIGAHESGLLGDDPNGIPNNLMPYIGRVAAGKLEKLTIYGGDYDTPDGTCQRDYLHVVDLAVGHLKALEYAAEHEGIEAINLGTGNGISVLELVNAFQKVNEIELPYVIGPRRDGDLPAFWADATKAKELLGWEAVHSVEDMCRSSWQFAKNASV